MEEFDPLLSTNQYSEDEHLLMTEVICDEAELLFLDCYLKEIFSLAKET